MNLHSFRKGGMKRISAILLAVMVLTACSEKGEVDVEEITATEIVSEEVTTVTTEETSASVAETEAEETTAETTVETTAETEESTTAETAAQTKDGTYAADKDSILGTWYTIDSEGLGEIIWTFNDDGSLIISDGSEQTTSTYIIDNGLMELTHTDDYGPYIQSYKVVIDEGVLIFAMEGINTELIREEFVPYEAGQSVYEYFDDDSWLSYPIFMSREKAVLAEQKDVLGKWIATECGEVVGTMLCEENSITMTDGDYAETMPVILKNGVMTAVGEIPENVSYSDVPMYLCGGKLYMFEDEFPIIIEKSEENSSENSVTPKLAQHEDLIGAWVIDENELYYIFEEDRYIVLYGNNIEVTNDKVKDGNLKLGIETDIIAYFVGDALHCEFANDDELPSIPIARYNQPAISAEFLEGKWYSDSYSEAGLWDAGWFSFENWTGIFKPCEGSDKPSCNAAITVIDDKIVFTVGDYSAEYTYYTVDYKNVYRKHIYLLGEENDIVLTQYY